MNSNNERNIKKELLAAAEKGDVQQVAKIVESHHIRYISSLKDEVRMH